MGHRTRKLFLLLIWGLSLPIFARADVAGIPSLDFLRIMRSVLFAENRVANRFHGRKGESACGLIARHLFPLESRGACFECAQDVHHALVAQGFPSADFKVMGLGFPIGIESLFFGPGVPDHYFTLVRLKSTEGIPFYVAIDPTLLQYAAEPFYDHLRASPPGRELIYEIRTFGFWVVTEKSYGVIRDSFRKEGKLLSDISFDKLNAFFDSQPESQELGILDRPKNGSRKSLVRFLESMGEEAIWQRILSTR